MPRFVILEHNWPTPHWDFLLESGPVLRAWRLLSQPERGREVLAEPNADHRLLYLDYEGPVGGERGRVRRWDAGTFEWLAEGSEILSIQLSGHLLAGRCTIARHGDGSYRWRLD